MSASLDPMRGGLTPETGYDRPKVLLPVEIEESDSFNVPEKVSGGAYISAQSFSSQACQPSRAQMPRHVSAASSTGQQRRVRDARAIVIIAQRADEFRIVCSITARKLISRPT